MSIAGTIKLCIVWEDELRRAASAMAHADRLSKQEGVSDADKITAAQNAAMACWVALFDLAQQPGLSLILLGSRRVVEQAAEHHTEPDLIREPVKEKEGEGNSEHQRHIR